MKEINHKEILRLKWLGYKTADIEELCSCSRSTIKRTVSLAVQQHLKWEDIHDKSAQSVTTMLFGSKHVNLTRKLPDFEYIEKELLRTGVTKVQLWHEYCEECRITGEIPYQSTQFNELIHQHLMQKKATMTLEHQPGETMMVDWNGKTMNIINPSDGTVHKAYLFVATLPWSGYTYIEAFLSMNEEAWIEAHVNAYRYFNGVTRKLISDNLKTGVTKNTKDELILNKTYAELAEHYGTAIIPARVRKPKDKAAVEGTVGIITHKIMAKLRDKQYFSLYELNKELHLQLKEFNDTPFQKKEGSRSSYFQNEQTYLLPLPKSPYELAEWKVATIPSNYHVFIDGKYYSCPYQYIGKKADVRITKNMIEIFCNGDRISLHHRLSREDKTRFITTPEHRPREHQEYLGWNSDSFLSAASDIGENTYAVIKAIMDSHKVKELTFQTCHNVLKLGVTYSNEELEIACGEIIRRRIQPTLRNMKIILKANTSMNTECSTNKQLKTSRFSITRGAEYYMDDES